MLRHLSFFLTGTAWVVLSGCLPSVGSTQTASCLPPIDMAQGEQVLYAVTLNDDQFSLRLSKTDADHLTLTRIAGDTETDITLTFQAEATCPNFATEQTLTAVEKFMVFNEVPFALLQNPAEGETDADVTATEVQQQNLSCSANPPYETCEADIRIENENYHWRKVTLVDGAMPGFGVSEFSIHDDSKKVLDIVMTQWNGL